jgi:Mg-chelatase subunit ChlD
MQLSREPRPAPGCSRAASRAPESARFASCGARGRSGPPRAAFAPLRLAARLACIVALAFPGRNAGADELRLLIDAPEPDAQVADAEGRVFVSGRALARAGASAELDVVVVIDTSKSTAAPSGADVDGDGRIGAEMGARRIPIVGRLLDLRSDDPGDSILAAEVSAARTLLEQLDAGYVRVGVVAFSGDGDAATRDAFTAVPLTDRHDKVVHGLERLLAEGPHGRTNLSAGIAAAALELSGTVAALSEPRPDAKRVILFMTDGEPTLPVPRDSHRNARLTIEAARSAAAQRIRIDSFAIGAEASSEKATAILREVSAAGEGRFTGVQHPADLVATFADLDLAEVESIEVRNASDGRRADPVQIDADGSFAALLPLRDGVNTIEVEARSRGGARAVRRLTVHRVAEADPPLLTARLLVRRARLLEAQLATARRRGLEIEARSDELARGALRREIEQARAADPAQRSLSVEAP